MNQILINSHVSYFNKTLPPLLNSLSASGCPNTNITVIITDATGSVDTSSFVGIGIKTVPYNNFDYSALRWVGEQDNLPYTHFINLHDTVTVQPHFWSTVKDIKDIKSMVAFASLNIGIYPVDVLPRMVPLLSSITNKIQAIVNQDFVFKRIHHFCPSFGHKKIMVGEDNFYGTSNLRRVELYPDMGIIKYHSNDGRQMAPVKWSL